MNGGRKAWLAKVDGQPLDVLTPEIVNAWRNQYAGSDPVARKSAERSAASYLRCARSLFTSDVLSVLRVKLPANPFAGVKLKDPDPQRYHSGSTRNGYWRALPANCEPRSLSNSWLSFCVSGRDCGAKRLTCSRGIKSISSRARFMFGAPLTLSRKQRRVSG